MEIKYKLNSRLLMVAMLGAIMTCASYLIYAYNPLQMLIKKMGKLAPDSFYLSMWSEPPYEVIIEVYIFNVTNSDEFLAGREKLRVEEIGPYAYQEVLTNENATFNPNGTLTFLPKRTLHFRKELSVGDPDTDRILSANIPLIGITAFLANGSMLSNLAVASISAMLKSQSFVNVTVSDYLWGYDDRLVTLANKAIPTWINFDKFGIFDRMMSYDAGDNTVTLNMDPGQVDSNPVLSEETRSKMYHIHRWNGSPGLKEWGYDENHNESASRCNLVEGNFEGTLFPPETQRNSSFKLYRRAFCRPVPFKYTGEAVTNGGIAGYQFHLEKDFLDETPENTCYCYKGRCLPKGLGSLAPCYYGMPVVISRPHFMNAEPYLLDQIHGMKPDDMKHDSSFILQPELGAPVQADLKIQINLDVGKTRYNPRTKPFNGLVLPLFWIRMTINEIPFKIRALVYVMFTVLPVVQAISIYLFGLLGLAMVSGSALFLVFFSRDEPNGRLSFRSDYTPIPILPIASQYFKPEIRISK